MVEIGKRLHALPYRVLARPRCPEQVEYLEELADV
jgi:hypothetical protein